MENGIKYSKNGQIEIFIEPKDERMRIEIRDHGKGISPQNLPHIFDPLYRVDSQTKGLGLGLFIVKEIIEKHLGKIEIDSELGEGTRFIIDLFRN